MGQVTKKPTDLCIGLSDPGMTPLLRAGLGGLAASLRAMLISGDRRARWPSPVTVGTGTATVERRSVTLSWGDDGPEDFLRALFAASFRIDRDGIIDLPGTYEPGQARTPETTAALQAGLERTFLQHGSTRKKAGKSRTSAFELDDRTIHFKVQPYGSFRHQDRWKAVVNALSSASVELAGWAYPGAAERHIGFPSATKWFFSPGEAMCGLFALVGCLSLVIPRPKGGVLLIAEPTDLVAFGEVRPGLTPRTLADAYACAASDAVLGVKVALRADALRCHVAAIARVHGITLRTTSWNKKQKIRVATVSAGDIPDDILDRFCAAASSLPTTICVRSAKESDVDSDLGYFVATSWLRRLIADNLAAGRTWYAGFSTARTDEKKPRFLHYYRTEKGLGALYPTERKGIIAMLDHLDDAERRLVASVHVALRNRFGAIGKETAGNKRLYGDRCKDERERWRIRLAGAKNLDQVRAALAYFWSRAGTNKELQEGWRDLLIFFHGDRWMAARDLALVALASYQGSGAQSDDEDNDQRER